LPVLRPDRYRVLAPSPRFAHRAGHAWEQCALPALAARAALILSPANLAPVLYPRNAIVIHDAAALRHPEAYSRAYVEYQRRMLPALARRARLLITVSEFSRGELVEMLGVAPEKVTVVPEGVDERFGGATASDEVAARYALWSPYVLALGTVSQRKNLGVLEQAARALREHGVELVVAGSDRGYLRGAPTQLRRLGYVAEADLPALYAGAGALAMPSRYEGFGLPCLEAMAAGTPVVAAAAGALPETVADAGVLVDPGAAEGFAAALVDVVTDECRRANLAAAGRRRAARYSWSATAALMDDAIASALKAPAPDRTDPFPPEL
jgi:glycosyltransferase involved in cell wall biosynthesis